MLGFLAILAAALCGLTAAPAWTVAIAALALASASYARHNVLFRRAADLRLQSAIDHTLAMSLFNGLIASSAAYGCGVALRYLSSG